MDSFFSSFYLYKEHKKLTLTHPKHSYIQYRDFRVDLISGKKENFGIDFFFKDLQQIKIDDKLHSPIVIHLFYEMGYYCNNQLELIPESSPLGIYIEYENALKEDIFKYEQNDDFQIESLSVVDKKKYSRNFYKIQELLKAGECYQINYTLPFYLRSNQSINPKKYIDLIMGDAIKVGAYSHATYIDSLGKLFLSNSPECLFQIKKRNNTSYIQTMPIKGTKKVECDLQREQGWHELINSAKDQAELFMITDLMRNDLTKLTKNKSTVLNKKLPLNVPGLIHQFSLIESEIKGQTDLKSIIQCLFPGGSITGAPKKRAMQIISELEDNPRGFYCGSTVLCYEDICLASLNIWSAEVD